MITIYDNADNDELIRLVKQGFIRAYTPAQVSLTCKINIFSSVHVFINPSDSDLDYLESITENKRKIILLGKLPPKIASLVGLEITGLPDDVSEWDWCQPAPVYGFSESKTRIFYPNKVEQLQSPISDRPLLRYDFAEEWNNLGFGHVRTDGSIWSLSCVANIKSQATSDLAYLYQGENYLSVYVSLSKINHSEVVWINRPVGLIDTHEFRLLENFITNYKHDELPCLPMIREVPYGYDAMISMRLDCDEDIASARPLFEFYKEMGVPFSLAIKTGQPIEDADVQLLKEVVQSGGSILSHSVNHKCNWGYDELDVMHEAKQSRLDIMAALPGLAEVDYAVSPFHQNPDYAVRALDASGYKGFIGGIICNDPQYLLARGGRVSQDMDIITHSQQCMLHGDCVHKSAYEPLSVHKQCAKYSIDSGSVFAYLDHPFSDRYQYGWDSEEQRINMHQVWIRYLKSFERVLFVSEAELLEHVRHLANINLSLVRDDIKVDLVNEGVSKYKLAYEYKGTIEVVD